MERVNRIAFVGPSNFNGSRAFVLISSNFCSISSNRSLSGDVSFRSVGEKRNELPELFPKAHVMEQVNRPYFFFIPTSPALASISILLLPFPKM